MPTNFFYEFLAGAGIVSQLLLLAAMLRSGSANQWRSLCTILSSSVGLSIALTTLRHLHSAYLTYFTVYWIGQAFESTLRIWLVSDVARSFRGLDFLPPSFQTLVFIFGLSVAVTSGAYAYHTTPHLAAFLSWAVLMDRAVSFAWMAFAASLLAATRLFNFGWSRWGTRITGFAVIEIISEASSAQARAYSHKLYPFAFSIDALIHIALFTGLAVMFFRYRIEPLRFRAVPTSKPLPHTHGRES